MRSPRIALVTALAWSVAQPAAIAAPAAETTIGTASFDARKTAISIPFSGPAPRAQLFRLPGNRYYYDIAPARLARGGVQHHLIGDTIARYTMANRPHGGVVRISFVLLQPGAPTVKVDAAGGRIVILPLGRESVTRLPGELSPPVPVTPPKHAQVPAPPVLEPPKPPQAPKLSPPPKAVQPSPSPRPEAWVSPAPLHAHRVKSPSPSPSAAVAQLKPLTPARVILPRRLTPPSEANMLRTVIGRPYLDDFHHRIVLPFTGPAPDYAIQVYEKNPRWVYLDFDQSMIKIEGERFETYPHPVFDGWMLMERDNKARLYLKFKQEAPVVAQVYPESGEIWFSASSPLGEQNAPALAPKP